MTRKYGFRKGKKDKRDFKYSISKDMNLPPLVDLRTAMPTVYDQGELGSCTANSISGIIEYRLKKEGNDFIPSRLFIYYNERVIEGTVNQDAGAEIRDGIKTINTLGVCHENIWAYDITKFADKPSVQSFTDAKLHKSVKYEAVAQTENDLKSALALGNPISFGFQVKASFENKNTAKSGIYKPSGAIVGGHAVVLVGYDDNKQCFIVRNSWGGDWGLSGYFYMAYKDVLSSRTSSDFWVIDVIK